MTLNQLKCLILGALFVNAALFVQGAEDNKKDEDAVVHHETTSKDETPMVIYSTLPNQATETPKKGVTPQKLVPKADEPPTDRAVVSTTLSPNKTTSSTTVAPSSTKPSTTVSPSSSSTTTPTPPKSSTEPAPVSSTTPSPSPPEYNWIVRGENGTVCILASMKVKLEYNINNTQQVIPVPENATGTGHCGNDSQVLQISWPNNTMTFSFKNENTSYSLSGIDVVSKLSSLNKTAKFTAKVKAFTTNLKNSYECTWSEPITGPLSNDSEIAKGQLKITITDVHVEAFHNSTSDKFSLALVCQTDASDIVPVMVGIALAVLVLVVLIVYVIGRRNSQARGYLSM